MIEGCRHTAISRQHNCSSSKRRRLWKNRASWSGSGWCSSWGRQSARNRGTDINWMSVEIRRMISFPPLAQGKLTMITAPSPPLAYSSYLNLLLLSLCSVTSGCEFAFSIIPYFSSSLHYNHMPTILPFQFPFLFMLLPLPHFLPYVFRATK